VPYKDAARKKNWERQNRQRRLARRRELRVEAAQEMAQPVSSDPASGTDFPWYLLAGGGVLAAYNPALALGAGSLILVVSALQKKSWQWWAIGGVIVILSLCLMRTNLESDA
jgi:hypothetical protein